jgi:aminoglycoside phosphotransferase (APT) family kinase protein
MSGGLSQPIAYGRTAEIYAWQEGQVLKLFYDWFELEDIEYEARIGRAIHTSGVPVPAVGDIIRVNGRNGLVYQRVDGGTMWKELSRKPRIGFGLARRMAELHVQMHNSTLQADIPSQRQKLASKIRHAEALPARLKARALAALETMPDGDRLCHGDFHPPNILMAVQGDIVIDWIDASRGNPLADLARSTIIALGAAETQIRGLLPKASVRIFHTAYIRHYFELSPGGKDEYNRWLPIVAAARLSEKIPEVEKWLIATAEKGL